MQEHHGLRNANVRGQGVDSVHDQHDLALQFHVFTAADTDLDHGHCIHVLRVFCQELLVRQQLLVDAPDSVELVTTDNQFPVLPFFSNQMAPLNDVFVLQLRLEVEGVYADGRELHGDDPPVVLQLFVMDHVRHQQPVGRLQEVSRVLFGLEPNEIRTGEPLQDLFPLGQTPEHLAAGERDVQREPDLGGGQHVPDHLRNQHQMVVVDPDGVALLVDLHDRVCELLVHVLVELPGVVLERLGVRVVRDLVVQGGPQDLFTVVLVRGFERDVVREDGIRVVVVPERIGDFAQNAFGHLVRGDAHGPDPLDVVVRDDVFQDGSVDGVLHGAVPLDGGHYTPGQTAEQLLRRPQKRVLLELRLVGIAAELRDLVVLLGVIHLEVRDVLPVVGRARQVLRVGLVVLRGRLTGRDVCELGVLEVGRLFGKNGASGSGSGCRSRCMR